MSLFRGLPNKTLKAIVPLFTLEEHEAAVKIFDYGMPGDKVYILFHGSVSMRKRDGTVFATLVAEQGQAAGKGSTDQGVGAGLPVFGEMAMIDRSTRMAAAVTATATKLLVLPVEQFAACMLLVPDIKSRLRRLKDVRHVTNARRGT